MNGHSLVSIMFLMSGILFFYTSHKKIGNNETTFSTFIFKKLKKFIPLALITTLFIYGMNFYYRDHVSNGVDWIFASTNPFDLIISIIFCGRTVFGESFINNGPLWFINVLLFCFLIAYPISKCKKNAPILWIIMCLYGLAMLVYTKEDYSIPYPFFTHFLGEGVFSFFFGVLIANLFIYMKKSPKINLISKIISGLSLILIIITAIFYPIQTDPNTWVSSYTWLTVFFYAPILLLLFNIKKCTYYRCCWL